MWLGLDHGERGAAATPHIAHESIDMYTNYSKSFYTNLRRSKIAIGGNIDLETQCGVLINGTSCPRQLTCKSHTMDDKRRVVGRSQSLYNLLCASHGNFNLGLILEWEVDVLWLCRWETYNPLIPWRSNPTNFNRCCGSARDADGCWCRSGGCVESNQVGECGHSSRPRTSRLQKRKAAHHALSNQTRINGCNQSRSSSACHNFPIHR